LLDPIFLENMTEWAFSSITLAEMPCKAEEMNLSHKSGLSL